MADPGLYLAAHRDTLTALAELCDGLGSSDWQRPTGCPGWSVQDQVAHVCDVESMILGDPRPEVQVEFGAHVTNPVSERMEPGVALRRSWSPDDVRADLMQISKRRLEQLGEITPEQLEETAYGHPFGPMPLRSFLGLRVFDLYTHEQDVRRAVGRPGDATGPAAQLTLESAFRALARAFYEKVPDLHGRRVHLDVDGVTATLDLTGDRGMAHTPADDPQWAMVFDVGNFMAWVGGRSDRGDFAWYGKEQAGDEVRLAHEAFRAHAPMTP